MWGQLEQIKELRAALEEIISEALAPPDISADDALDNIIEIAQRALEAK